MIRAFKYLMLGIAAFAVVAITSPLLWMLSFPHAEPERDPELDDEDDDPGVDVDDVRTS